LAEADGSVFSTGEERSARAAFMSVLSMPLVNSSKVPK
jgi:hypothetical protein